ncbi:interleukin-17F-like [Mustelus asterias]
MLCKFNPRSLMVSAVLLIVMLTIPAETTTEEKVRNKKTKMGHPRLRRATKYMLDLNNIKMLIHPPSHTLKGGINNRSISPWIYKEDIDANRYPSTIFKAECESSHCKNSRGNENQSLNTHLVRQEIIVLKRKKDSDDKIIYRAEKMLVPVACVCVLPNSVTV